MQKFHDNTLKEYEKPADAPVHWRISGYAAIRNEKGEILIVQPVACPERWDLPGGGVNVEESLAEGIARECYEETGYKVGVEKKILYVGESYFY